MAVYPGPQEGRETGHAYSHVADNVRDKVTGARRLIRPGRFGAASRRVYGNQQ
jgi:hypothetical protein